MSERATPPSPETAQSPADRRYRVAVQVLDEHDLSLGERVVVFVDTAPPASYDGMILTATPTVLVLEGSENVRHRLPWANVAAISTTHKPEHPGN